MLVVTMGIGFIIGLGLLTWAPRGRGILLPTAVAILFFGYSPSATASGSDPLVFLGLALGLVIAGAVGPRTSRSIPRPKGGPLLILLLAFIAVVLVASAPNLPEGNGLIHFAGVSIGALLTSLASTPAERRTTRRGVVLVALAESLLASFELLVAGRPLFWTARLEEGTAVLWNPLLGDSVLRMAGTAGHPILLSLLLTVGAALVLSAPQEYGPRTARLALLGCLVLGEVASGSRSGVVALVAVIVYTVCASGTSSRILRAGMLVVAGAVSAVLAADFASRQADKLVESGSWMNRTGSLAAVPDLVSFRSPLESLVGSGWASEERLFSRGFLNQNGFGIVDNQFVTTLATGGMVGLGILVMLLLTSWRRGDRTTRSALIVFAVMAFSFDFLVWANADVLLFAILPPERATPPKPSTSGPSYTTRQEFSDDQLHISQHV